MNRILSRASGCMLAMLLAAGFPLEAAALEKRGFYAGFDGGHAWFREFEDDTSAFTVRAGFRLSRHYAIEVGQLAFFDMRRRFAGAPGEVVDVRINDGGIFSLSMLGIYPVGGRWSLHGRAGVSLWSVFYELESSDFPGVVNNRRDDDQTLSAGLGLTYDLNGLIGIRAVVDYYAFQPSVPPYEGRRESAPVVSLGIVIRPL